MGHEQQDIRQHLLDTGAALILSKGFNPVGLSELLTTAGVPRGSFYYYFASKEQFGEALLERYFSDYLERLDALLLSDGTSARDRIMKYWTRWLEIQGQGPCEEQCMVVKLSAEVADLSEAMRASLLRGTNQVLARLTACLEQGVAEGSLAPTLKPEPTAHALYALWLGASLLTKVRREPSALAVAAATTENLLARPQYD